MRKYIYKIFTGLFIVSLLIACSEEQGTIPGNDENPAVTVYDYKAKEPFNPDNDIKLRIATNNKVEAIYLFVEKSDDRKNKIDSKGIDSYLNDIVANSSRIDVKNKNVTDTIITGILGKNIITVVGVGSNGKKAYRETFFEGLVWEDLEEGKFSSSFFKDTWNIRIQKASGREVYRLPNLYKEGFHFIFKINEDNSISFEKQETGVIDKKYGLISFGPALNGSLKDGKTINLVGSFSVKAGSFGEFVETLTLP